MNNSERRVLIVSFDALRPDMVTPELMPNLTAFAAEGIRFSHSRSTFPSETRVNQTALVTGCYPAGHGIVGNKFMEPVAAPGELFNTGDEDQLAAGDRRLQGRLLDVTSLGEILAAAGKRLAVISAGTPGGTRILHHRAETQGDYRLSLHRPDASVPVDQIAEVIRRLGPIPAHEIPSLSWLSYATDAYLSYVEAELKPEVAILWFCEPDNSYHHKGIGAPENLAAIRQADTEFGRILAWRESAGLGERLQIITLSDHGQLNVSGPALDLAALLRAAGFTVGGPDGLTLVLDSAGGINLARPDPALKRSLVAWLQAQPWCGPVFTAEGEGCLAQSLIGLEHRRAPDIALALRADDSPSAFGIAGSTRHDSHYPEGGGLHGGLHWAELSNWLACGGDGFVRQTVSDLPTGIIDVLPTILHLLGLELPAGRHGRLLREALVEYTGEAAPEAGEELHSATSEAGIESHLSVSTVAGSRYLNRGWVGQT